MLVNWLLAPPLAAAYAPLVPAPAPRRRGGGVRCTLLSTPTVAPFQRAQRLEGSDKPTVWGEFGQLAAETGAVNLGQGFPDWQPPEFVVEEAHRALREGHHQYTRPV